MKNNIIFVDFENIQNIKDEHLNKNSDIIILIGLDQDKKAYEYTKILLDKVSSVNLIKVNGRGSNALDFFLILYLGINYEKIKNNNLIVYLYSDDKGYKPLIEHLQGKGISIEAVGKKNKENKIQKKKETKSDTIDNEKYEKILKNISPKTKNGTKRPRPKTLKGLKSSIETWLNINNSNEINKLIEYLIKNKIIIEINGKIDYKNK